MTIYFAVNLGGEGRVNCRSLGFARDDKGDGSAPIEVVVLATCLRMPFIALLTCPRKGASQTLLMNKLLILQGDELEAKS